MACGGQEEQPQGILRLRGNRAAELVHRSRPRAARCLLGLQAGAGLDNKSPAGSPAGSEKGPCSLTGAF